jgi:hypothetical protein
MLEKTHQRRTKTPAIPAWVRLLIVLLILLDTLRRARNKMTTTDKWMLGIETAVLLLILLEVGLNCRDRWRTYKEEKELESELEPGIIEAMNSLDAPLADQAEDCILGNRHPDGAVGERLNRFYPKFIDPNYGIGFKFRKESLPTLRRWAKSRRQSKKA